MKEKDGNESETGYDDKNNDTQENEGDNKDEKTLQKLRIKSVIKTVIKKMIKAKKMVIRLHSKHFLPASA